MRLTHYSAQPWELDRSHHYEQGTFGNGKPNGLWLSDDDSFGWKDWCEGEQWRLDQLAHRTEFVLAPGANVKVLDSTRAIYKFHEKFSGHPAFAGTGVEDSWINWDKVVARYDGIIITPYQWSVRLQIGMIWYYGWDCASGCIWNLDAIEPA